ncbi:hypothetical protein [Mesorhizobium sp. KR1-2]|uniref:hypothetical protein n=1 Tax=Mesorhizobium sp. KR1-2 TaxID=3156609 RepID=UPI0032B37FB3
MFAAKLRLDGNSAEGDKAAYENVFRHLWHLHYWLAHALVWTFSPFLSTGQTPRPAGWSFIASAGLRRIAERTGILNVERI